MSRNKAYDNVLQELTNYLTDNINISGFFQNIPNEEIKNKYLNLTQKMLQTYESKDTDYSENDLPMGNLRESSSIGIEPWKGVLLRIGDKKRRISSFVKRANYLV